MNIIFSGDGGNVIFTCIFSKHEHLCFFWPGGWRGAYNVAYAYRQKIPYFHAFFDKDHLLSFSAKKKKKIIFSGINTIFLDITKKIVFRREFPEKTIFPEHLKKIWYFQVLFWERSSFLLCLKNKIIFSGKRNIIFPDNTRKIIFQCDFFGKTIFSKHLEKENMVSRAVGISLLKHPWNISPVLTPIICF